ncbi:hypothetical protein NPJ82_09175 [Sphingomonas sp. NY01]
MGAMIERGFYTAFGATFGFAAACGWLILAVRLIRAVVRAVF